MAKSKELLSNIGGVHIWGIPGELAFFFKSSMNVDADGAPGAYNPGNSGLDNTANAGRRVSDPLLVVGTGGLFTKNYQYLMGYKGLAFYTKSAEPLQLPATAEVIAAKGIWTPS